MVEIMVWFLGLGGGDLGGLVELEWRSHLVGDARCKKPIYLIIPSW